MTQFIQLTDTDGDAVLLDPAEIWAVSIDPMKVDVPIKKQVTRGYLWWKRTEEVDDFITEYRKTTKIMFRNGKYLYVKETIAQVKVL